MRSKTPSSGDRLLLEELERRGRPIALTRIERWRYWRGTGLVPRTIQHGKGRGSYSELPDLTEAADRVCEVAELLERYRDLDNVALVLSARGRPLDPASVQAALVSVLEDMEHGFRSHQPRSDDPLEVASNAARALERAMSRGRRSKTARKNQPLALPPGVALIAGRLLAGDRVPTFQLQTLLTTPVLEPLLATLGISTVNLIAAIQSLAPALSFRSLRARAEGESPRAITAALQNAKQTLDAFLPRQLVPSEASYDFLVVGVALAFLTLDRQHNQATPEAA
jgi:hypothetical protein